MPRYDWEPEKSASNEVDHGVSFDAMHGFEWSSALEVEAGSETFYVEEREGAIGFIGERLYFVAFTLREDDDGPLIRIIMLRRATKLELKRYVKEASQS